MRAKSAESRIEFVERFKSNCMARATGEQYEGAQYKATCTYFLADQSLRVQFASFVCSSIGLVQFWSYIQPKFKTYRERRVDIYREFEAIVQVIEGRACTLINAAEVLSRILARSGLVNYGVALKSP